jgi:predicted transport protein
MSLFKIENSDQLEVIKEQPFKLEKDIQSMTEKNLKLIFDLNFVKSEFTLNNFRIDTLAFDKEAGAFVIIEYKRDKNFSVIDQGYAYLSLMLNNKADFILEYNENTKETLKRNDVDWSQSRVIFISPSFTTYQKEAINFKDLPIELWEIKRYNNRTVNYNQIKTSGAQESVKTISRQDEAIDKVSKEIKVYTEDEHLEKGTEETKELYETLKNAILNLDDLEVKPKKKYIAFVSGSNVVDIHIQRKALKMWLNLHQGDLDDPKKIARDVSSIGHWGNGDYEIVMQTDERIEYIMSLIKQSFNEEPRSKLRGIKTKKAVLDESVHIHFSCLVPSRNFQLLLRCHAC